MRPLTSNTLIDISRHSNKAIKLADYMVHSDFQLLYSDISKLTLNSDPIEVIEAFHKDVKTTSKQLEQVYLLLSTVDKNGDVIHLKNEEKNLKKIFGKAYNLDRQTINFNSYTLNLKSELMKDQIRYGIIKNILGLEPVEYDQLFKDRNKIFTLNESLLYDDNDKVKYLSIIKDIEKYQKIIDTIREIGEGYSSYRAKTTLQDKNIIDREITFNRAMIDSVTKQSTYISKEDGIVQVNSAHKKEKEDLDKILQFVKDNEFVAAIELGANTDEVSSLKASLNALEQSRDIKFNLGYQVVFKSRLLGNYNANGLYLESQQIVSCDMKNPSALIHEFIHAVDFGNPELFNSSQRRDIVQSFRNEMDREFLVESFGYKRANYYLSSHEIIARLGEISYLLIKHDYKEGEGIDNFQQRVKETEIENNNPYDLNLVKPISTYVDEFPHIYFNLKNIDESKLLMAKEFYKAYMGVEGQEIKPIKTIDIKHEKAKVVGIRESSKYVMRPVSLFNSKNITFGLDYNDQNKIIDPEIVLSEIFENITHMGRTTLGWKQDLFHDQINSIGKVCDYIKKKNDPYLNYILLKEYYKIAGHVGSEKTQIDYKDDFYQKHVVDGNLQLSVTSFEDKYKKGIDELEDIVEKRRVEMMEHEGHNHELHTKWNTSKDELKKLKIKGRIEFNEELSNIVPEADSVRQRNRGFWFHSAKKSGRRGMSTYSLLPDGIIKACVPIIELAKEILLSNDIENTLMHLKVDDELSYALMANKGFRTLLNEHSNISDFNDKLMGVMFANGVLDNAFINKTSYLSNYKAIPTRKRNDNKEREYYLISGANLFENINISKYENHIELWQDVLEGKLKASELRREYPDYSSKWIHAQFQEKQIKEEYEYKTDLQVVTSPEDKEIIKDISSFVAKKESLQKDKKNTIDNDAPIDPNKEAKEKSKKKKTNPNQGNLF